MFSSLSLWEPGVLGLVTCLPLLQGKDGGTLRLPNAKVAGSLDGPSDTYFHSAFF